MAKLFLSYSRKDAVRATRFAKWLEREGHDVWRDDDDISGGASFSSEIETALKDCDAVLVLWSQFSHGSAWVRDEAAVGRDAGKLIPLSLDQTTAPLGFRQFQTIELSKWKRGEPQKATQIRQAIAKYPTANPLTPTQASHPPSKWSQPNRRPLVIGIAGALTAVAGLTGYYILSGAKSDTTTISIVGEAAGSNSADVASTISAEMAPVLAARAENATITDPATANDEESDFQIRVAITPNQSGAEGRLTLSSSHERGIVWSRNWASGEAPAAALKQQMSFVASIAMLCALEGHDGGLSKRQGALGFYVQACTRDYDSDTTADELITLFTKTVERAPDFSLGWANLATIYSGQIGWLRRGGEAVPIELIEKSRSALKNARKGDPRSARAILAEGLAQGISTRALPFMDRAADSDPNDPLIRYQRAAALMVVGRQADAIGDVRRAVELTPPSPGVRGTLVATLMNAGRLDEARAELAKAEGLWPNDIENRLAKFNYELEYGDPRIAQRILPSLAGERAGLDDRGIANYRDLIRAKIDGRAPTIDGVLAHQRSAYEKRPKSGFFYLYALGIFNRTDEIIELLSDPRSQSVMGTERFFVPQFRGVRANPRFMKFAADRGLVSYWRSSGKWPDFCNDADLRYDCRVEAAKYK